MRRFTLTVLLMAPLALFADPQRGAGRGSGQPPDAAVTVLRPARVFDGDTMHEGWAVRVRGDRIEAAGPAAGVSAAGATTVDMPGRR